MTKHPSFRRSTQATSAFAIGGGIAAYDATRVVRADELLGTKAIEAAALGAMIGLASLAFFIWIGRPQRAFRKGWLWRALRILACTSALSLAVALFGSHVRFGSDALTSRLQVVCATCTGLMMSIVGIATGIQLLRPRAKSRIAVRDVAPLIKSGVRSPEHRSSPGPHQTEVWHVEMPEEDDYFISRCECDWVGTAYDNPNADAEARARAEANSHSANVRPDVVRM